MRTDSIYMSPQTNPFFCQTLLNFSFSMTNKLLFIIIGVLFLTSKAKSDIVFVDMDKQNGNGYNTLIVFDGIRKVYGDSVFQLELSKRKGYLLTVFLTRHLEVDSVRLFKKEDNYLRDDLDKWDEFVDYLKKQTFCFPLHAYDPKYSVAPTFLITTGLPGVLWEYVNFKIEYPEKSENMIEFHNYLSEHFRTYKFDLYEYNGKEWVITKKDVVLYNH